MTTLIKTLHCLFLRKLTASKTIVQCSIHTEQTLTYIREAMLMILRDGVKPKYRSSIVYLWVLKLLKR